MQETKYRCATSLFVSQMSCSSITDCCVSPRCAILREENDLIGVLELCQQLYMECAIISSSGIDCTLCKDRTYYINATLLRETEVACSTSNVWVC